MKILMLIAHGSRKQTANDEIRRLAERVEALASDQFDAVAPAFLEIAQPDIQACIESCVGRGATEIVAVPYFLAAGKHVARDIPAELACAQAGFSDVRIDMASYVGESAAMPQLILDCTHSMQTDQ